MDYYKIGQQIRRLRKMHGLSQEELAERINISTTHMSHTETGNTKMSLPVLVDLAAALHVRTDDILGSTSVESNRAAMEQIAAVLQYCTSAQAKVIVDTVQALKQSMDKHL